MHAFKHNRTSTTPIGLSFTTLCIIFGSVLFMSGCSDEAPEPEPIIRPVKMVEFGTGSTQGRRAYPGDVKPADEAVVSFELPGEITSFPVTEGQRVQKGAVLARLDDVDYRANYEARKASLLSARTEYQRHQQLYEQNAVSRQVLEASRLQFDVAEAELRTAENALENTVLVAPFSGVVAQTFVEQFQQVQPNQTILMLHNDARLKVKINIPERDVLLTGSSRKGLAMMNRLNPQVEISTAPDWTFPAQVTEFATSADPVTRTFEVTLDFDPPADLAILPGMTARVTMMTAKGLEHVTQTLPPNAVISDNQGNASVWVVDRGNMQVNRVQVEVGPLSGDTIEVVNGLAQGALVAASGVHHLREGMQVRRLGN